MPSVLMQKDSQLILSLEGRFTCGRSLKLNVKLVLQLGITDSLLAQVFFQQMRHGKLLCTVNLARLADFKIEKYRKNMVQICWFSIFSLSYFGGLKTLKEHQVSIYRYYNSYRRKLMQCTLLAILLLLLMV